MGKKVTYISIINAIAIIAVLIGHLDITGINNDPNTPVANIIARIGYFQMPLFMCVSGFLFAMTSGYKKSYNELIRSKVKRLIIPFLFLTLFTFGFKMCLPASMLEHGIELTPEYLFNVFFVPFRGPVPHMWFVVSLFTIFLLTPIFKWTAKTKTGTAVTLLLLTAPPLDLLRIVDVEVFALDKTFHFMIWFYLGIIIELYGLSEKLNSWWILLCSGILYTVLLFFKEIPYVGTILTLFFGVIFIFALAHKFANTLPNLFKWWRNYTYQIYLMHMYPIMAWKYVYNRHLMANEALWFWIVWCFGLASAIVLPVLVAKIAEKMPQKVRMMIGL